MGAVRQNVKPKSIYDSRVRSETCAKCGRHISDPVHKLDMSGKKHAFVFDLRAARRAQKK